MPHTQITAPRHPIPTPGLLDRLAAALLILVLLPVLALAALFVLLSGPGEVVVSKPTIRPDGGLSYRSAFRTYSRFEPAKYDASAPMTRRSRTLAGALLRTAGIARLPVLFDIWAGRIGFQSAFAK